MKNIILLLLLINCTAVFAQSDIATTPTDELYGYYKKGQSFETIQTEIKNYEALLKMAGYTLQNSHIVLPRDYTLLWRYKHGNGGEIDVQIHYQFLIPYFKITIDQMIATYNGDIAIFTLNSKDKAIREIYATNYDTFVQTLVRLIKPAKTLTKEQLREALKNLDKLPESNPK